MKAERNEIGLRGIALVVAACIVGASAAADFLWIGGASGDWGDAKNWRDGVVPNGADAVARIESTSDVTISVGDRAYTVGAIRASGGRHVIVGSGYININASSGTGVVDVAENAALTAGCRLDASVARGAALAKTGLGTFEVTNLVGRARPLNGIDVRQGAFNFNERRGGDHINPGGRVTVRAGATANLLTANLLVNDTVIDVKAGGTFDANGKSDLIAAIVGEGLVTNSANFRLTLKGGPHVFSGRISGRVTLERWKGHSGSLTDIGYEPDNAKRLWVVGTRDGLADATVAFVSDLPDDHPLSFSPKAGGVFDVGAIEFPRGKPFALKDTAGNPVEVRSPPPVPEHVFRARQLRAECARFNAAAAARALDDLAKNRAHSARNCTMRNSCSVISGGGFTSTGFPAVSLISTGLPFRGSTAPIMNTPPIFGEKASGRSSGRSVTNATVASESPSRVPTTHRRFALPGSYPMSVKDPECPFQRSSVTLPENLPEKTCGPPLSVRRKLALFVTCPSPTIAAIRSDLSWASNVPPASTSITVSFTSRLDVRRLAVAPARTVTRPPGLMWSPPRGSWKLNAPCRTSIPLNGRSRPVRFVTSNVPRPVFASVAPFAAAASRRQPVVSQAFSATSTTPVPDEASRLMKPVPTILCLPPETWIAPTV